MNYCAECGTQLNGDAAYCPECGTRCESPPAPAAAPPSPLLTLGGLETIVEPSTGGRRDAERAAELPAGSRFADRYTIEQRIGVGGMGMVYRALDSLTGQQVALKVIRPDRIGGEAEVKRLLTEGVTARNIRHHNVIAVYDVGTHDAKPFLSMELLGGPSLRAWHRARKASGQDVPAAVASRIIGEILAGLKAAHDAGVIHRDLKPENVMLLGEPTADAAPLKILDFGIARAIGTPSSSGSGTGLGTPRYMAPEQITEPDLAGPPADLYSLSVMFYELLVDVLPQGHWQPPSGGRSDVAQGIDDLIQRGLANRPASRPQSAVEYAALLAAATPSGGDVLSGLDRLRKDWQRKSRLPGSRRAQWIAAGVIGAIAAVSEFLPGDDDPPRPNPARPPVVTPGLADADTPPGAPVGPARPTDPITEATPADVAEDVADDLDDDGDLPSPATLSGTWYDGLGGSYRIGVDARGYLRGSGVTPDGFNVDVNGRIDGEDLDYRIGLLGQLIATGEGYWDGSGHLSFTTHALDGTLLGTGYFHVNHGYQPSCP